MIREGQHYANEHGDEVKVHRVGNSGMVFYACKKAEWSEWELIRMELDIFKLNLEKYEMKPLDTAG